MSNNLIKYALVFFVLSGFSANCANAQSISNRDRTKNEFASNAVDLSTDEAVIAELQKIGDAKRAELGTTGDDKLDAKIKNGGKLDANSIRIKRFKDVPEIIVIGSFKTEYGFHLSGVFVDSRYFVKDDADLTKNALAALGWEKAPKREREMLANFWVGKVLPAFSAMPYQTLSTVSMGDGKIKVIVSSKYPPGVTSRHAPKVFVFDKDGSLLSASGN